MVWSSQATWSPLLPDIVPLEKLNQSVEEKIVSATVVVIDKSDMGGGSGVLVRGSDGEWYCWTAYHVVEGLDKRGSGILKAKVTARLFDHGTLDLRVQGFVHKVIAIDKNLDLAFLQLILPDFPFTSAVVDKRKLELGQTVLGCGHVNMGEIPWHLGRGHISQAPGESSDTSYTKYWQNGNFLIADIGGGRGCSGGGVWNTEGRLIGILVGWHGPGIFIFVHNDKLVEFAKYNDLTWALGKSLIP